MRTVQSALRGAGRHEQETVVSHPAPDPMGNKAGYKWIKTFLQPEFWRAKSVEERERRIRQRGVGSTQRKTRVEHQRVPRIQDTGSRGRRDQSRTECHPLHLKAELGSKTQEKLCL